MATISFSIGEYGGASGAAGSPDYPKILTLKNAVQTALDAVSGENSGTLAAAEANILALQNVNGVIFHDSNAGVGDQVGCTDTNPHAFTEKCSVGAAGNVADDILLINGAVFCDNSDSTPEATIEVLVGTTVVDTLVIATAAANDFVTFSERIKLTTVGGSLVGEVTSTGLIKDATISQHGNFQAALAITASSTAGYDVTARVTCDAGHANNLFTLRNLDISILRASV